MAAVGVVIRHGLSRTLAPVAVVPWRQSQRKGQPGRLLAPALCRHLHQSKPGLTDKQNWGRRFNIVRWLFKIDDKKEMEIHEANLAKRKELTKEYRKTKKGYFGDFGEVSKTGGKRFTAPETITKSSEAPRFPSLQAESLAGVTVNVPELWHGKVTFVTVGFRAYSKPMIEKYREVFLSRFKHEPGCQLYEVNVIDQYLYRTLLGNVIKTNMANEIEDDPKRQRQTLCYLGPDAEAFKDKLGIFNAVIGYGFLVDKKGRIRWQVHGDIGEGEVNTLARCVSELLSSSR